MGVHFSRWFAFKPAQPLSDKFIPQISKKIIFLEKKPKPQQNQLKVV